MKYNVFFMIILLIIPIACGGKKTVKNNDTLTTSSDNSAPTERIAVLDFKNDGIPENKSRQISELIRTEIINTHKYIVIERSQIDMIFKEHGFGHLGATDSKSAVKVGKMLAARKIMIGTVMKLGETTVITGRIVDVEKGIAEFGARVTADDDSTLLNGITNFVQKITGREIASDDNTIVSTSKSKVKSKAKLKADKSTYKPGEDIIISYKDFPGTKYDYISIAKKGASASSHYTYQYTSKATEGSITFYRGVYEPGTYEARAHTNYSKGDYTPTAIYTFTVK